MEFVTVFTFLFINILALGVTMGLSPNMYRDVGDFSPISTDVIIIGGGATGAGIARDCALRGINCILLERRDIATGATGRNHGLLHSGARYAVNDQESAEECIKENKILRNIARHCVDERKVYLSPYLKIPLIIKKRSLKVVPNPVLRQLPLILN